MSSVVFKYADQAGVSAAVESYAAELRRTHPEVKRIIWFGSWVNGLPMPYSDVDLCLVLSHSDKPFRERIPDYLGGRFPVGVDVFPYTAAEFDRLKTASPGWYAAIAAGREIR